MKKTLIILLLALMMAGCGKTYQRADGSKYKLDWHCTNGYYTYITSTTFINNMPMMTTTPIWNCTEGYYDTLEVK
jgi:hypothetical protein